MKLVMCHINLNMADKSAHKKSLFEGIPSQETPLTSWLLYKYQVAESEILAISLIISQYFHSDE